jgi:TatD DNase family protein
MLMKELALEDRVVAIGEVGLDFYQSATDRTLEKAGATIEEYINTQKTVFRQAIQLAQELEKPLIIHSREAYDEIIKILKENYGPWTDRQPLRGTVHCYMGNWAQAQQLLALGFMLGFTGVITYDSLNPLLLDVVKKAPLDRLLIETDAPYLTPEPYRTQGKKETGKTPRNRPEYSTEEVIQLTEANACRLFAISPKYLTNMTPSS